jgi:hypothetical protein
MTGPGSHSRGAPRNVHPLGSAPQSRESFLDSGNWLILTYSRLSAIDVASIRTAVEAADRLEGIADVGVRPSVDFSDLPRWCPECGEGVASPIWIVLRDGVVLWEGRGPVDAAQVADRALRWFATPMRPGEPSRPRPVRAR